MRWLQQTFTLLLLVLTASGCGLPSGAGTALRSVVKINPAAIEAGPIVESRELVPRVRMRPRTSRELPVRRVSEPATIAAAVGDATESDVVLGEAPKIKARLEQIRTRATARSRAPRPKLAGAARPVVLVSTAERRRANRESEATADWRIERGQKQRSLGTIRRQQQQRRPSALAPTRSEQKVVRAVKRGAAWFDVSGNTSAKSDRDSSDDDSVWDLDAAASPFTDEDAEW